MMGDRPALNPLIERELTLAVCWAGGEALARGLNDPSLMSQENWAGELASRVYAVMRETSFCEDGLPTKLEPETPRAPERPEAAREAASPAERLSSGGYIFRYVGDQMVVSQLPERGW